MADFFSRLFGTNPTFALIALILFWAVVMWLIAQAIRYILRRVFEVPLALQKTVLQVLVPKEPAKKEEEDKSSKKDYKELIGVAESFYAALGQITPHWKPIAYFIGREDQISLEIVAIGGLIKFYLVVPTYLRNFVEQQFHAQYPSAQIEETADYNIFRPKGFVSAAPLVMTKDWLFQLKTYKKMDSDPLNAITNALSKIEENQGAAIQIMIRTAKKSWRKRGPKVAQKMQKGKSLEDAMSGNIIDKMIRGTGHILNYMMDQLLSGGKSQEPVFPSTDDKSIMPRLTPMEQELIKSMEEKASKVGFEANVRVVACADKEKIAKMHVYNICNVFAQYLGPESGVQLKKHKQYQFWRRSLLKSIIYRRFDERRKCILSTEELSSLYHPPLSTTETPNIQWLKARSAPPPVNIPKEGIILGESFYRGRKLLIRMLPEDRRRHTYVIGMTGTGKTTIMTNMIIQDITNGEGCAFIDPHGEAIQAILESVPPERADDVVLFEPADMERPVGLNMLEAKSEDQKDFAVQEMIAIFYKLFPPEMIGPMFEHNMRNVMLTLMTDQENPGTIAEIPRMFSDNDFAQEWIDKLKDPVVRAFWEKEMAKTSDFHKSEMLGYLISKVGRFVENTMMRNIIGQTHSGFDLREVMDNKKILLVNLSNGQVGEVNSNLLGLIIVSKLQMAAMSRVDMPESQRNDFFLYIDEFQNFITDSIATILAEARKYRLDLIMGHQYIGQLIPKQGDTKVRDAIFGNVGSIVAYRVGVDDAETMAKQMAPVFNEFDVMNIDRFTAYTRLMIHNTAARPFNMRIFPPPKGDRKVAEAIRQLSRLKYGRDREIVEAEILERSQLGAAMLDEFSDSIERSL
ncbi:type IV secretion system DNA-binding domain-containing protein [Candidatus Uhrbacteria bacterium]|nr:type IV secretion system DNA-binding domain-containing protein [Candidatus Uhrbacteria bacterium]